MCVLEEEWRPIEGYEGLYEISSWGRIKSFHNSHSIRDKRSHIIRLNKMKHGRFGVFLYKNGKHKRFLVHRLVAQTFIPNPNNYTQVNHKDENPSNNRVDNLEWCTAKYNLDYSHVCEKMKAAAVKKQQKAVLMYDKEGNFIREYESATIAAQAIGNHQQNVSACCYGKQNLVSGYKFKFK